MKTLIIGNFRTGSWYLHKSYEAKGYIWKFGNLSWKDATQSIDLKHPDNLRGAYLDKSDMSSSEEKFIEKSMVLNANVKYQEDILLTKDEHRRLVLGWDEHIKPKVAKLVRVEQNFDYQFSDEYLEELERKGKNRNLSEVYESKIYEHKYFYPPDDDYNEYLRILGEEKSRKGFNEKIELKEDTEDTPTFHWENH